MLLASSSAPSQTFRENLPPSDTDGGGFSLNDCHWAEELASKILEDGRPPWRRWSRAAAIPLIRILNGNYRLTELPQRLGLCMMEKAELLDSCLNCLELLWNCGLNCRMGGRIAVSETLHNDCTTCFDACSLNRHADFATAGSLVFCIFCV